jgi:hypothetical protein
MLLLQLSQPLQYLYKGLLLREYTALASTATAMLELPVLCKCYCCLPPLFLSAAISYVLFQRAIVQ